MPDGAVIDAAMPLEQAAIGGFLRQSVTKHVKGSLGVDAPVDELETAQLAQLVCDRPGALPHGTQQAQRELPAYHRRGLE